MNESFFHDGVIKQTKFLLKKQVNEFIRVKIVIILNYFCKNNFDGFYVKEVTKSVP